MAFTIIREDLARVRADAIVVPANKYLTMTGGTGLAVAKAAGYRRLTRACKRLGGCPVGQAVATPAYRLPAEHIIHAVGPIWRGGDHDEARILRSAYDNSLGLALRLNAQSVALPLLSAGTFGYPIREAFEIAVEAIRAFLETADMDVILVLFDKRAVTEGSQRFGEIAEYIDDAYADEHGHYNQRMSRRREAWADEGYFDEYAAVEKPVIGHAPLTDYISYGVGYADQELDEYADSAWQSEEAPSAPSAPLAAPVVGRFCERCGAPYEEGSSFCTECGSRLDAVDAAPTRAPRAADAAPSMPSPTFAGAAPSLSAPAPAASKRGPAKAPTAAPQPKASASMPAMAPAAAAPVAAPNLGVLLAQMDAPFSTMLMQLIDESGLTDAQVYKRANISRQHFSKMRNPNYRPTKKTVVALAIALELPLPETRELLARAGFALTHSNKFDIIVEYYISRGDYDIFEINETLFAYDQPVLD